ncbi:type III polyketide synthase [Synechococcus sp. 8F6]|uniref:type III polyketide synthase n=1 Tax=Synechococcus sp. 8F6 TaxID=2025606 RepID=UPI000B999DEA|nr:type III polyketide synthase [Synechococcus sp. 8F6]
MPLSIRGIGTATPPHQLNQAEAMALAERVSADNGSRAALVRRIQGRTQVRQRGSVLATGNANQQPSDERLPFYGNQSPTTAARMAAFADHAAPLALDAVRGALADAAIEAPRITHLITVCCTGFQAPGLDLALIHQLGLDPGVQRTHVGFMGCHGALNGLRVAQAFVEADAEAVVLLCAVELCSLHLYYGWDPEKVVANALFADGAAALVATAKPANPSPCPGSLLNLLATGSTVIPHTADLMHWQIGDHGFEMGLSSKVPEAVAAQLGPWLEHWLHPRHLRLAEIASWAVHPGGPRILQACAAALQLEPHQIATSQAVLQEHGNMSSATILFILDRLRQAAVPGPCLALAFGPGLCAEVALLELAAA